MAEESPYELVVALVTCPEEATAERIARVAVDEGLAACVNIIPSLTSIYQWQGKVESAKESLLLMKTSEDKIPMLEKKILTLHPYDTPEFIVLPIMHAEKRYGEWLGRSLIGDPLAAHHGPE